MNAFEKFMEEFYNMKLPTLLKEETKNKFEADTNSGYDNQSNFKKMADAITNIENFKK